jgi:hypothetical protein
MTEQITIAGKVFAVPLRYQPGHALTAAEAIALNQTYHEALRNNFAKRVKDQLEHGHFDQRVLQGELDVFAAEYEFGSRRNRSRVPKAAPDPVLVEAQKIARETLNAVLRERGLDATPEAKARKVAQWVEEKEWIMAQARERLAERAAIAAELIGNPAE